MSLLFQPSLTGMTGRLVITHKTLSLVGMMMTLLFDLISDVISGVEPTPEEDAEIPGVDTDFYADHTGVEVDSDYVPQELTEVDGLGQQDTTTAPH